MGRLSARRATEYAPDGQPPGPAVAVTARPGGSCHQGLTITDQEFSQMRRLIYDRFGINLTEEKRGLLVSRLQRHLISLGHGSFTSYYEHLVRDSDEKELGNLVDRISTNHTFFNRENDHFDFFSRTALPAAVKRLKEQGRSDLRIWCAGCSSGEEAYMILMLMHEFFGAEYGRWSGGILATDISNRALAMARAGVYAKERMKALPIALRDKYFRRLKDGTFLVRDELRQEATIRRLNLIAGRFPFQKPFQIIFCRNVMIYFDQATREGLVRRFHECTEPRGYLFIGHSETLGRQNHLYRYIIPAVYQKEG